MKSKFASLVASVFITLSLIGCAGSPMPITDMPIPTNPPQEFCYFDASPTSNVEYTIVRSVKVEKGTYGSVSEVIPKVQPYVENIGGNAIMNFRASQRFSILPWSFVSPVAMGKAIFITDTKGLSCEEMGGHS